MNETDCSWLTVQRLSPEKFRKRDYRVSYLRTDVQIIEFDVKKF